MGRKVRGKEREGGKGDREGKGKERGREGEGGKGEGKGRGGALEPRSKKSGYGPA